MKQVHSASALRFEDLKVWKNASALSSAIYNKLKYIDDFEFRRQINRSALSISSNIAEGHERESIKECITFLSYAKGSCGELRSQIYIGMEIGHIDKQLGESWVEGTNEISSMLSGLIKRKRTFLKGQST